MMDLKLESSELKKLAPQVLTRYAKKLGFLTKKNYFEIQQLYHLVAKDWKETLQILKALLAPQQWRDLQSIFQEWLFAEVAHRKKIISRAQGDYCIQKKIDYIKQGKKHAKSVLEDEKLLNAQQVQKIKKALKKIEMLPKIELTPIEAGTEELAVDRVEFGRYKILRELGQGGMGKVYQAYDIELKRTIALKLLLTLGQHTNNPKRFFREAQLMGKLRHPNIVKIYDIGEWKENKQTTYFFTMEWIDGHPLDELIQRHRLTIHQSAEMLRKIAIAISYAHKQGIIHRDIKPSNIVVDQQGEPWLMDFGLAKIIKGEEKLSKTGSVLGTPVYMPPEQASGKIHEINELSDIYSMGALFYEMLTGVAPFRGDSSLAIILQVVHSDPLTPRKINRNIPVDLESICLKAMEKVPYRRYPSGEALAEDLHCFLRGLPVHASPPNIVDIVWRKFQRNRTFVAITVIFLVLLLSTAIYWSYKEYRLLKDLQDCTKLVLGLQQIATKNPGHREQLVNDYLHAFTVHIKNNDRNAAAYLGRGFCQIMMGNYQKSYSDLTETIKLREYSPLPVYQLYLLRADCSIEYAHYQQAMDDLRKANVPDSELGMGKIYNDFGKYDQAMQIFDRIIQDPDIGGYSWESLLLANAMKADLLSKQGQPELALQYSSQAIKCIPFLGGSSFISINASTAYATHAIVLSRQKKYQEAEENFLIASHWFISNEAVFSYRGKMYAQRALEYEDPQKMEKAFQIAWQDHQIALQTPSNGHYTYYNVACFYALQKKYPQALEYLKMALEKGYRDFTWVNMDPDMKEMCDTPQVKELLKEYSDLDSE